MTTKPLEELRSAIKQLANLSYTRGAEDMRTNGADTIGRQQQCEQLYSQIKQMIFSVASAQPSIYVDQYGTLHATVSAEQVEAVLGPHVDRIRTALYINVNGKEEMDAEAWAELHSLREAVKGPDGYATWQEAATAERIRRVKAEREAQELNHLIEQFGDALVAIAATAVNVLSADDEEDDVAGQPIRSIDLDIDLSDQLDWPDLPTR